MQVKHTIFIFLIGLLVGVGLSPFTNMRPQQALKSPIPVTLAHMPQAINQTSPNPQVVLTPEVKSPEPRRVRGTATDTSGVVFSEQNSSEVKKEEVSKSPIQKTVTIAIFGDSMVDTMGTGLPYLKTALANYYPNVDFVLHNYGVGAQNVEGGLARVDQSYSYHDRNYLALTDAGAADIVIIGSFAYNPFPDKDINHHWIKLAELIDRIRDSGKKVLILAENAPAKEEFGSGPNGINWPQDTAFQHAEKINQYLESACGLALSLGIPLVDAYHPTLLAGGEGNQTYINQGGHIHPNVAGHKFIAQKIAEKIWEMGL